MKIQYRSGSDRDIEQIFEYIKNRSPSGARNVLQAIFDGIERIAELVADRDRGLLCECCAGCGCTGWLGRYRQLLRCANDLRERAEVCDVVRDTVDGRRSGTAGRPEYTAGRWQRRAIRRLHLHADDRQDIRLVRAVHRKGKRYCRRSYRLARNGEVLTPCSTRHRR